MNEHEKNKKTKMHFNATNMQIKSKRMKMSSLPEFSISLTHTHTHKRNKQTNKRNHHKKKFLVEKCEIETFFA